jgi:polysaccharide export outer membrane protein
MATMHKTWWEYRGTLLWVVVCLASSRSSIAQSTGSHVALQTSATVSSAGPLLLGAGDLMDVQVFNTPELSAKVRVGQGGFITLPAGAQIKVDGLTPVQAGAAIEQSLRGSEIMLDPHVTVFVNEYATQGITVLGEVRNPGTYTLLGGHSLYEALSAAGGMSANAGASITLTHRRTPGEKDVVTMNSANYSETQRSMQVEPGDIIVVAKADMIFVVGDVGRPGAFYVQNGEPMSVLNALALASGLNHTAAVSKASIVRKTDDGAVTIPLDLNKIMKNKDPNLMLLASDVLVVPRSGVKVFLETAIPGATTAVTGAVSTALVLR